VVVLDEAEYHLPQRRHTQGLFAIGTLRCANRMELQMKDEALGGLYKP
jgi:hypothetical protein